MITPAAILILLLALYIAWRVDTHRTRVRRRKVKDHYPSATVRRLDDRVEVEELDDHENKISE